MNLIFSRVVLIVALTLSASGLSAQNYKELVMDTISQKANTWCWAASIEMVIKFFKPNFADSLLQPEIIKKYTKALNWKKEKYCPDCSSKLHKVYVLKNSSSCELSMESRRYDYMDQVFNALGFHSSQELNLDTMPIPWQRIQKLIDDCRPFIVFLDPLDGQGIPSNHAIVAKGYYITSTQKYIVANDPFSNCNNGRQTIFPYTNFLNIKDASLQGINIDRVSSIVADIRPAQVFNSDDDCISCSMVTKAMRIESPLIDTCVISRSIASISNHDDQFRTGIGGASPLSNFDTAKIELNNPLMSDLVKVGNQIIGFEKNIVSTQKVDSALNVRRNHAAFVEYLSLNKLKKCLFFFHSPNKISSNLDHNEEVIDVVSGIAPIISTLQKDKKDNWHLTSITDFTTLREKIDITVNNKPIVISNLRGDQRIPNSISYNLVKMPPLSYEFFTYQVNGQQMVTPADFYPDLGLEIDQGYPEKKLIKKLRKIVSPFLAQETLSFWDRLKILFGSNKMDVFITSIPVKSKI